MVPGRSVTLRWKATHTHICVAQIVLGEFFFSSNKKKAHKVVWVGKDKETDLKGDWERCVYDQITLYKILK